MKTCKGYTYINAINNAVYAIVECKNKKTVRRCVGYKLSGRTLESTDKRVRIVFPVDVELNLVARAAQAFANWFSKRLMDSRGKVGYHAEVLGKIIAYIVCKESSESITKCLKSCEITTPRGRIGWKAIYQLYSNSKDAPKEPAELVEWQKALPRVCK